MPLFLFGTYSINAGFYDGPTFRATGNVRPYLEIAGDSKSPTGHRVRRLWKAAMRAHFRGSGFRYQPNCIGDYEIHEEGNGLVHARWWCEAESGDVIAGTMVWASFK